MREKSLEEIAEELLEEIAEELRERFPSWSAPSSAAYTSGWYDGVELALSIFYDAEDVAKIFQLMEGVTTDAAPEAKAQRDED